MLDLFEKLYQKIEDEAKRIISFVNCGGSYYSDVFDSTSILKGKPEKPSQLWGRKGIYIFIVENAITMDAKHVRRWNEDLKGAGFKTYAGRQINDGDCLYVGSCVRKSLYSRIREHFSKEGSHNALKLAHPARSIMQHNVMCYVFMVKKQFPEEYYRILLPAVEKILHGEMLPLCGSSRV